MAVLEVDEGLHHAGDIFLAQRSGTVVVAQAETAVELHAPHRRQVVTVSVEEQVVEQGLGRLLSGRLARTHHAVDLHLGI